MFFQSVKRSNSTLVKCFFQSVKRSNSTLVKCFFQSVKRSNPILDAKRRKELNSFGSSFNWTTPEADVGKAANRNPFKKSATPKDSPRYDKGASDRGRANGACPLNFQKVSWGVCRVFVPFYIF